MEKTGHKAYYNTIIQSIYQFVLCVCSFVAVALFVLSTLRVLQVETMFSTVHQYNLVL